MPLQMRLTNKKWGSNCKFEPAWGKWVDKKWHIHSRNNNKITHNKSLHRMWRNNCRTSEFSRWHNWISFVLHELRKTPNGEVSYRAKRWLDWQVIKRYYSFFAILKTLICIKIDKQKEKQRRQTLIIEYTSQCQNDRCFLGSLLRRLLSSKNNPP